MESFHDFLRDIRFRLPSNLERIPTRVWLSQNSSFPIALKEYRIWTDSSNVYQHLTGEGFDGDEQLHGIEALRAILIHALYSGYCEVLVNGRTVDVLQEAMEDRYLSKYYDLYIARMRYTETLQSLAKKKGFSESRIRRLTPELENKGLVIKILLPDTFLGPQPTVISSLSRQTCIMCGTFGADYGSVCCQNCTEWSLT